MTESPLRIVRRISGSPEEVFDAWTSADSLALWMCPGSIHPAVVDLDARVGGRFRILMKGLERDYDHTGEYLVLDRPRRLVFTWISEATHGRSTTVTVALRGLGRGETELTLTHEGLPDEEAGGKHESGWADILKRLAAQLPALRT